MGFTLKTRETWAKNKAKELGYKEDEIVHGDTHVSFMREGKAGKFSGVQIGYPMTPLELLWKVFKRSLYIVSTGFLGYLVGVIIVSAFKFNYDAFGSITIRWALALVGAFIGYKYKWMVIFI